MSTNAQLKEQNGQTGAPPQKSMQERMDAMYRLTRHVYDASRKYFLLGRDTLIDRLAARPEDAVCEIGCGTARNLIKMAAAYPKSRFYGIDVSEEMLKTARQSLKKAGKDTDIAVAQAYAENFDPAAAFKEIKTRQAFERIVFSYALSIIPQWQAAFDNALTCLKPGGTIHIVDFGSQEKVAPFFRAVLFKWLSLFHVYYKPEILEHLRALEQKGAGTLEYTNLYGGYAYYCVFTRKDGDT